jgi:translation initiation factor 2 subunit 3
MLNLGTLGSVSDGKSEMIYQLSGIRTQRDSRERKRNITIKAGYANIKLWKCLTCNNEFSSCEQKNEYECIECNTSCKQTNHISFTDCPGHQELIDTMLTSISLMKGAIIIISVVESIKQKPQLIQHLIASKVSKLDKVIICLNKCDLVTIEIVKERKKELDQLLKILEINPLIIIPTSFTQRLGIDNLIKAINLYFKDIELTNQSLNTLFRITRSFDINQPGTNYEEIKGGCIGGSLISGNLNINDIVQIKPGILTREKNGKYSHQPIETRLLSFESDKTKIDSVKPGGLVGILTELDPYYCKNDLLKGNIITKINESINVYNDIKVNFKKITEFELMTYNKSSNDWNPKPGDKIYIYVSNMTTEARVTKIKNDIMEIQLIKPICIEDDSQILITIKQPILNIVACAKMIN